MKQGYSGCCVIKEGNKVIKWTRGRDSSKLLRESALMQIHEQEIGKLYPIKPVKIESVIDNGDFYSFQMPFIDLPTGFDIKEVEPLRSAIMESLYNRCSKNEEGFRDICNAYLKRTVRKLKTKSHATSALFLVYKIEKLINQAPFIYPFGYCHGGFGFANMFVGEDVHITDFTESFIYSPLMDIVTLEASIKYSDAKNPNCVKIAKDVMAEFKRFSLEIEIIKKLSLLNILANTDSMSKISTLIGRIDD